MIRWVLVLLWVATGALAQVTVEPERSVVRDGWWTLQIDLRLSEVTPYRVFTLDDPKRLVLDFHDLDWTGVDPNALLDGNRATAIRIDDIQDQWSRMVIDLAEPLEVVEAGMRANQSGADLKVVMERTSKAAFAAASRTPSDLGWNLQDVSQRDTATTSTGRDDFVVVLDPGHGGIDPGAERAGLNEAELMLTFAQETATALAKVPDLSVVLTRDEDVFVPLFTRITIARAAGADMFISLHADALAEDEARGAAVYTLTATGQDRAAQQLVERHGRGDLLAGVDLLAQEDRVASVLMDMARADAAPIGLRFADALVAAMRAEGVEINSRPRREGQFAVLSAADFPSVLIEVGFLSNAQDRAVLQTSEGRARITDAIVAAVTDFKDQSE